MVYNIDSQGGKHLMNKGVKDMIEEMAVFKGYLRSLMRQLKALKEAMKNKDYDKVDRLIDELIEDTQNNIED